MNHQSRNKYYSDERSQGNERGNRNQFSDDRPSWDLEDEDEDLQGGQRASRYRSSASQYRPADLRNREHGRSFYEGGGRSPRDSDDAYGGYPADEFRGARPGFSQRSRGDWDEDQERGGSRSWGSSSRGRDYESSYDDFERTYRQPDYSSSTQGPDWRDNPQRGGASQSRYGTSAPNYGSSNHGSSNYGSSNSGERNRGFSQRGAQSSGGSPASANYWYSEYWLIPGPYSGSGPKGYQRSSESLKEQVCERLEGHGEIDASEIEVAIENGEVTLTGKVESREQKRLAEDCAGSVRGVKDVHNQLKVESGKRSKSGDNPSQDQMGESGSRSADKKGKQPSNPAF